MRQVLVRFAAVTFLLVTAAAQAGLPADYGAMPFEQALSKARSDGKPVMLYFGEDW